MCEYWLKTHGGHLDGYSQEVRNRVLRLTNKWFRPIRYRIQADCVCACDVFQLFKGTFYYCKGPSVENITNRTECEDDRKNVWINHKYNFDNLGMVRLYSDSVHQHALANFGVKILVGHNYGLCVLVLVFFAFLFCFWLLGVFFSFVSLILLVHFCNATFSTWCIKLMWGTQVDVILYLQESQVQLHHKRAAGALGDDVYQTFMPQFLQASENERIHIMYTGFVGWRRICCFFLSKWHS